MFLCNAIHAWTHSSPSAGLNVCPPLSPTLCTRSLFQLNTIKHYWTRFFYFPRISSLVQHIHVGAPVVTKLDTLDAARSRKLTQDMAGTTRVFPSEVPLSVPLPRRFPKQGHGPTARRGALHSRSPQRGPAPGPRGRGAARHQQPPEGSPDPRSCRPGSAGRGWYTCRGSPWSR